MQRLSKLGANFSKIIPSGSVNSIDSLIEGFAKPVKNN